MPSWCRPPFSFFSTYLDRIQLPHLRYSLFSGEALPEDITREWSRCVPNAVIENHYEPDRGHHRLPLSPLGGERSPAYNGIVAIGAAYEGMEGIVVDEHGKEVEVYQKGELWISGDQVTPGYWKNDTKNRESFTIRSGRRFYKTGDIVFQDEQACTSIAGGRTTNCRYRGIG